MVNKKGWAKDAADWQKQDLGIVDRNPLLGLASLLATAVNPMHLQNFMMLNKATKPGKSYDFVNRQIELGLLPENRPSMFRKRKKRVGTSWRMDETYLKVNGTWHYYYRASDFESAGPGFESLRARHRVQRSVLCDGLA